MAISRKCGCLACGLPTRAAFISPHRRRDTYQQLLVNAKVELCFYVPPETPMGQGSTTDMGQVMRATGTAEFIADPGMKERLLSERPFIRPFAENVVIFRVQKGEVWFWAFADSGREAVIERVRF